MTLTKKQLENAISILITRVETINERTKKHTIEIKELRKELNQIREK